MKIVVLYLSTILVAVTTAIKYPAVSLAVLKPDLDFLLDTSRKNSDGYQVEQNGYISFWVDNNSTRSVIKAEYFAGKRDILAEKPNPPDSDIDQFLYVEGQLQVGTEKCTETVSNLYFSVNEHNVAKMSYRHENKFLRILDDWHVVLPAKYHFDFDRFTADEITYLETETLKTMFYIAWFDYKKAKEEGIDRSNTETLYFGDKEGTKEYKLTLIYNCVEETIAIHGDMKGLIHEPWKENNLRIVDHTHLTYLEYNINSKTLYWRKGSELPKNIGWIRPYAADELKFLAQR